MHLHCVNLIPLEDAGIPTRWGKKKKEFLPGGSTPWEITFLSQSCNRSRPTAHLVGLCKLSVCYLGLSRPGPSWEMFKNWSMFIYNVFFSSVQQSDIYILFWILFHYRLVDIEFPVLYSRPLFTYFIYAAAAAKSLQSCPTLCNPIDGSPPGSPVPGILQARTLEWVAISFSNVWKWKVEVKSLNRDQLFETPWTAAHQAPPSMGFSRQEYWSGVSPPSPRNLI